MKQVAGAAGAALFELCVRMLLETWPQARGQRFPDLDEGRQRLVLERLALHMQENRGSEITTGRKRPVLFDLVLKRTAEITIGREDLETLLFDLVRERELASQPQGDARGVVRRWIEYLAAGTGLLCGQSA